MLATPALAPQDGEPSGDAAGEDAPDSVLDLGEKKAEVNNAGDAALDDGIDSVRGRDDAADDAGICGRDDAADDAGICGRDNAADDSGICGCDDDAAA